MTIVLGLATPDGLVLGADSRTTSYPDESPRSRIASDSAEKVFVLGDRFGVATYGDAFIGERTIAGLMTEFVATLKKIPKTVDDLAAALGAFFHDRYARAREAANDPLPEKLDDERLSVGFLVAGYDDAGVGVFHEVWLPGPGHEATSITTAHVGMLPRGQRDVIDRLLGGVDMQQLLALDVTVPDDVREALDKLAYQLMFPITLKDGVDFVTFLIRTTIEMQRFSDGTFAFEVGSPNCGGPTSVAVIRRRDALWVSPPAIRVAGPLA
jgi:hypothetical protein